MSYIQANICQPCNYVPNSFEACRPPSTSYVIPLHYNHSRWTSLKVSTSASKHSKYELVLKHRNHVPAMKYQRGAPVCLLGGKDKSEGSDEISPWKAIEKAMGNQSVEDLLRQQMKKQEYYDEGSGKNPPGGGGGGNGGRGGDGSEGPEDEGFTGIMDETLQVVLATMGFIFLYAYIITGEELARLAKDYIKFLFSGSKSVRLTRAMNRIKRFFDRLTEKKVNDKYWLEKAIINTPTLYDSPEKYRRIMRSLDSSTDEYP
ncbi:uncharacterized protein LOC110821532 [Carica papaya]|uniref:uncharacterized protein LOC110821532 n=1 Tax=Carica papaya TaxID=3649 RepID=UPI000B8D1BF2|nr:uncharacterized protein LOC110821532 [Carica papaya]XP_021907092.1 uncharacterized protein LOC110821532 [Carica papaya]